jgi:hypothetical protein
MGLQCQGVALIFMHGFEFLVCNKPPMICRTAFLHEHNFKLSEFSFLVYILLLHHNLVFLQSALV